ncbi:MAG: hypothetical protein GNW80_11865 [Asgard group archaeon]|nr:hypothetical protein [Asgard group archaeon]
MEFEQYGKEIENLEIKFNPFEFAESNLFKEIDNAFGYIKKRNVDTYTELINRLTTSKKNLPKKKFFNEKTSKIMERIKKSEILSENKELVLRYLNAFIETQGITDKEYWQKKEIKIPARNFFHSANNLYYLILSTLVDILGKDEAIKLYKETVDNYVHTFDTKQMNIFTDLEDMRQKFIRWTENSPYGRVRLLSTVENGQWIRICKNCEKVQNLDNLEELDGDLMYAISCYCHEPLAKMWNENFVLTLEQTIAKGDPFCSYVYHDKSIADKIEHPPRKFFEEKISNLK